MKIPEFSVHRPVTVLMFILIIVVVGGICLYRLPIELMPDLSYPVASIITGYEGVASEDIESLVTKPIESAASSVKNVKTVNSISQEGLSIVMVEFEWGTQIDFAAQDLRDAIGILKEYLPTDADDPIVIKFDPAMIPAIAYGITGHRDLRELRTLVKDDIKDRIEMVDGVATAMIMGGREREIQVLVDRSKLEATGIPIGQVATRLRFENLNLSGGHVTRGHVEYLLRTMGEFEDLDQVRNTIAGVVNGAPVYIRDFASVVDTYKEPRNNSQVNQCPGVILAVLKESGANTVEVVDGVKKQVEAIKKDLPPDIHFFIALDQGRLTRKIIAATLQDALWGGLITVILILLVLRNWRPTVTIFLAIPLSIIATFIFIYGAGYTLNIMTMSGIALGVGMLVSNAIIVIENIFRHMEEGSDRRQAAVSGTSEVGMAIAASTLTTVAVFLPMFFATGIAGKVSRGLALTVVVSLAASLFVALTLVPMMASKIFRAKPRAKVHDPNRFGTVDHLYGRLLHWTLQRRWTVCLLAASLFAASLALLPWVNQEFMPVVDPGMVIIKLKMPIGTPLEETRWAVRQIEDVLAAQEEIDVVACFTGLMTGEASKLAAGFGMNNIDVNEALIYGHAVDQRMRARSSSEIQASIRRRLPEIEGGQIEFIDLARFIASAGMDTAAIEVKIFGKDIAKLETLAERLVDESRFIDGVADVESSLRRGKPELRFTIDRKKASQMGFSVAQIAAVIRMAFEGQVATLYRTGGDEYDLRVKYREQDRNNIRELENIVISSPMGSQHRVSEVTKIGEGRGPVQLFRENQKRRASVIANFSGGDLGSIVAEIKAKVAKLNLPSGYFVEYGGEIKRMREMFGSMGFALILAVLLVYMVMAAQFESLVQPLAVMFTVPFGATGVILMLLATGASLSLPSWLGLIIMVGIVVNNGIVLVDYANQLRDRGRERHAALVEAAQTKLRAMLLTAVVAILGMLPMAISRGEGAEMRAPIAMSVIGGMLVSTFLMLVVIPVFYSILDDIAHHTTRRATKILHG